MREDSALTATLIYLAYNREERDLCTHLFRLLLEDQPRWQPLKEFLGTDFSGSPRLYTEAALIRDAYHARKPDVTSFMDQVCEVIATQEGIASGSYTKFSELEPADLRDPRKTHPKQLSYKLKNSVTQSRPGDEQVYGSLQTMFNAKPDLVICVDSSMFIYEAKYTMSFDETQLERTRKIGQVWAELLYQDLGFESVPHVEVCLLGLMKYEPAGINTKYRFTSWEHVRELAEKQWMREDNALEETDFSVKVFSKILNGKSRINM